MGKGGKKSKVRVKNFKIRRHLQIVINTNEKTPIYTEHCLGFHGAFVA